MSITSFIDDLEEVCGNRVLVIGASWRRDIATDLDRQAARAAIELVEREDAESWTIIIAAKGGRSEFADMVVRSFRARQVPYDLAVPTMTNVIGAMLALGARKVLVHPHGGVGAIDCGPLVAEHASLNVGLFDDIPALGGISYVHDSTLPARLADGMKERRLSRLLCERIADGRDVDLGALSHVMLGDNLALGAEQLAAAGLNAETWDEPTLWSLYLALESALGVLETAAPRYTESDLADEVEFAPAEGLLGAIIATRLGELRYELDTGSPDPDTGRYAGAWSW